MPSKPQNGHPTPPKKSAIAERFGKAVRLTRERVGYTQERFAQHADIDRSYFAAIERGEFNISLDTILKIAWGLDTKASALFRLAGL